MAGPRVSSIPAEQARQQSEDQTHCHNLRKNGDYILGVVFYPKPSSVSDVAGIQSMHANLN